MRRPSKITMTDCVMPVRLVWLVLSLLLPWTGKARMTPSQMPDTYPGCKGTVSYIADGLCDFANNNEECAFDGGDCCEYTCRDGETFICGDAEYDCQDPDASFGEPSIQPDLCAIVVAQRVLYNGVAVVRVNGPTHWPL